MDGTIICNLIMIYLCKSDYPFILTCQIRWNQTLPYYKNSRNSSLPHVFPIATSIRRSGSIQINMLEHIPSHQTPIGKRRALENPRVHNKRH